MQPKRTRELLTFVSNNQSIHNERLTASQVVLYATHTRLSLHIAANAQWRRQAWGTGARAPWNLRIHANFADLRSDGFHFWMTLSPRTLKPVRHAPVPPPPPGAKFWRRHCKCVHCLKRIVCYYVQNTLQ